MFNRSLAVLLACVAFATAAPMPQSGLESPGFSDVADFAGEEETQFSDVETGVSAGPESDPSIVGFEQDPDYYYDSEPEAADAGAFADYTESDSNIGHRVARSPARRRGGSGRFGPVRRRQFKLGGFRQPNKKKIN